MNYIQYAFHVASYCHSNFQIHKKHERLAT